MHERGGGPPKSGAEQNGEGKLLELANIFCHRTGFVNFCFRRFTIVLRLILDIFCGADTSTASYVCKAYRSLIIGSRRSSIRLEDFALPQLQNNYYKQREKNAN